MAFVLETQGLSKRFGGLVATRDVSFGLETGARHALIGPNGAGKTTLVNLITGVLPPSGGSIWLNGEDITRLPPEARVRRGLARTFQISQLFKTLTVHETLGIAVNEQRGMGQHGALDLLRQAGLIRVREEGSDLDAGGSGSSRRVQCLR